LSWLRSSHIMYFSMTVWNFPLVVVFGVSFPTPGCLVHPEVYAVDKGTCRRQKASVLAGLDLL
jgi:hypothetical protein